MFYSFFQKLVSFVFCCTYLTEILDRYIYCSTLYYIYIAQHLPRCLLAVNSWTTALFLKLNWDKAKADSPWLAQQLWSSQILLTLGFHIDVYMSFDYHVSKVVTSSYIKFTSDSKVSISK